MISSNTRATRSRYSSPAQPPNGKTEAKGAGEQSRPQQQQHPSKAGNANSPQSFMQRWLEPTIQNKSSFEEAGLMRFGVLESMAPLGSLPKPKKPSQNEGDRSVNGNAHGHVNTVRKIILRPSGFAANAATTPVETYKVAASSPAVAVGIPESSPKSSSTTPTDVFSAPSSRKPLPVSKEEDLAEQEPQAGSTRPRQSGRLSLSRKPRRSSASEVAKRPSPSSPLKSLVTELPPSALPDAEPAGREFVDKVVEAAVDEALEHHRYPTAWALRTLYDEKADDEKFIGKMEKIFGQTADVTTRDEFARLVEERKRQGRREDQCVYYFIPPDSHPDPTQQQQPKTAPYANYLLRPFSASTGLVEKTDGERSPKKKKVTHEDETLQTRGAAMNATTPTREVPPPPQEEGGEEGETITNGIAIVKTPSSKKRLRRESASSDSSLSSLSSPEVMMHRRSPLDPSQLGARGRPKTVGRATAAKRTARSNRASVGLDSQSRSRSREAPISARPINTSDRSIASKPGRSDPNSSHTQQNRARHQSSTSPDEDATEVRGLSGNLFPNLPGKKHTSSAAAAKEELKRSQVREENEAIWSRRREAQKVTNNFATSESSVRHDGLDYAEKGDMKTPTRVTRSGRQTQSGTGGGGGGGGSGGLQSRSTRQSNKRTNDDAEGTTSPIALSFQGDGGSALASRASTPTTLRPAKKQRGGVRVKLSPKKKSGGTAAGVPRALGESSGNGTPREHTSGNDNDEYCSACGNSGDVVCCDGCPRSFHFECIGMSQMEQLPDEWFCNTCFVRKYPSRVPIYKGSFASALNHLEKSNPQAFSLPPNIQNRFEGVRTGTDGDYEDIPLNLSSTTRISSRKKNGLEGEIDYYKQREYGQAVLCHDCQGPAAEGRAIIPCSICPYYWHTDCLNPPMAIPPLLKTWKCPAHVDDVLAEAPLLAPAHRYRRLKNASAIVPALSRGLKNNGHIEIDWVEEFPDTDKSGWVERESFGKVYKVPAKGIVLDFIEQLRRRGTGYGPVIDCNGRLVTVAKQPQQASARAIDQILATSGAARPVHEMQASLNLLSLGQERLGGMSQLVSALLSSADDNILSMMAQANADNLATEDLDQLDRQSLRAMLAQMDAVSAQIRSMLGDTHQIAGSGTTNAAAVAAAATEPKEPPTISTPESVYLPAHKGGQVHNEPVTEPTPPSTIDQVDGTMELD